ncbi:PA2779 family protein [Thioalkalivibrio sp. XN279]|uniref:PA2779 family protein n=1 Tax=Thioalkalivibrio sp. XN279 TaxID=2714953 RepID=UPI00140BF079|nr:PA2779 family protein [Thioalkalivibrio sp. XN279]NHA14038.1 PA2779 family protein [Thioalkalivibrio sp. XN279]
MKQSFVKVVAIVSVIAFGATGLVAPAHATIVGTQTVMMESERAATVARVQAALDREAVQAQLEALGVDTADARARVAALSDAELQQLDGRLAELPAGAGVLEVVGIVFVVLLILEIVGVTNIFSRI